MCTGGPSKGRQIPGSVVTGSCKPLLSLLPGCWEQSDPSGKARGTLASKHPESLEVPLLNVLLNHVLKFSDFSMLSTACCSQGMARLLSGWVLPLPSA